MNANFLILFLALSGLTSFAQSKADPIQAITNLPWHAKSSYTEKTETKHFGNIKPLYVIFSHGKIVRTDSTENTLSLLSPQEIKSLKVLRSRDSISVARYGKEGKARIVEIYLDDEKYPDAYKRLKRE